MCTRSSIYSVHPGVKMIQDWIKNLPQKTGKSLDDWAVLLKKTGPKEDNNRKSWLKKQYGFSTHAASWIVNYANGQLPWEGDPESYLIAAEHYVEEMFAGVKKDLRPIYDKLLDTALKIGSDVRVCPCKTIVPFYRTHVFAQVKPATKTRIDLGLALGDTPFTGRLIDTGGSAKKDRITHRVEITQLSDIDAELVSWLKKAYLLDV